MTQLFGRSVSLKIGIPNNPSAVNVQWNDQATGADVSGFDFEFEVEKTLKPEPNTCAIRLYNVAAATRQQLSGVQKLSVQLDAGYQGNLTTLYLGEVRAAWTERQGPDFITHIESGDGEKQFQGSRLNASYGPKVPLAAALQNILKQLGLGAGNSVQIIAKLSAQGVTTLQGGALTGSAARRMTDICRSAGLEWSIQDGAVQLLQQGAVLNGATAFQLEADTGLIESPTVDSQGIVSATCLLIPGLIPGCLVNFSSLFVNGSYRVQRCRWSGSTFGNEWQVGLECKLLKGSTTQ
jgi:hypothetical protein